jgi:hypothetical protein
VPANRWRLATWISVKMANRKSQSEHFPQRKVHVLVRIHAGGPDFQILPRPSYLLFYSFPGSNAGDGHGSAERCAEPRSVEVQPFAATWGFVHRRCGVCFRQRGAPDSRVTLTTVAVGNLVRHPHIMSHANAVREKHDMMVGARMTTKAGARADSLFRTGVLIATFHCAAPRCARSPMSGA